MISSAKTASLNKPLSAQNPFEEKRLNGRVDIIDHDKKIIYELKYVSTITEVHKLQLLMYYYLASEYDEKYYDYSLVMLNLKDGKKYTIHPLKTTYFL